MPRKFESHLTMHVNDGRIVEEIGHGLGWKYSQIEGDALMGPKPYCYLTGYDPDGKALLARANDLKRQIEANGVEVLRVKIEEIVYDTKTGVDSLQ